MTTPQTSYDYTQPNAFAGMIASGEHEVLSYRNQETSAIPFGIMVAQGTLEGDLKLMVSGAKPIGVLVHTHAANQWGITEASTAGLQPGNSSSGMGSVMREGRVYVLVEQTVTVADPVYYRHTANGAGKLQVGAFRMDADTSHAYLLNGGRWIKGATAGNYAELEFDINAHLAGVDSSADAALRTDLADTANAKGAALVGVEDSATRFAGATVEACLAEALVKGDMGVVAATPGAEGSNAIDVVCALQTVSGVAIEAAREVEIETLAVTDNKGDLSAATSAVGTLNKAVNPATGPNVAWMTSTSGGLFSFKVTNDVAETTMVRITADGCRPKVLKLTFT